MDYSYWDTRTTFAVWDAAHLWYEIDPRSMATEDPRVAAVFDELRDAVKSWQDEPEPYTVPEKLRALVRTRTTQTTSAITRETDWQLTKVKRSDLLEWAESRNERPPFLFPTIRAIHREPARGVSFPTPPGTTWEQVVIRFKNDETVEVVVGSISKKYNFAEMGFKDCRKGDVPDEIWATLKVLAQLKGELSWQNGNAAAEKYQKNISILRRRLKQFMSIDDDPFHPYIKHHAYRAKFLVTYFEE